MNKDLPLVIYTLLLFGGFCVFSSIIVVIMAFWRSRKKDDTRFYFAKPCPVCGHRTFPSYMIQTINGSYAGWCNYVKGKRLLSICCENKGCNYLKVVECETREEGIEKWETSI